MTPNADIIEFGIWPERLRVIDPNLKQAYRDSCAIKCQQLILKERGIIVDESELREIATVNGWFQIGVGMFPRENGKLLNHFGINYSLSRYNNVEDLSKALAFGNSAMVKLNYAKLKILQSGKPYMSHRKEASHASLVTYLKIDKICSDNSIVLLTDTETGTAYIPYKLNHFLSAWSESDFYMLNVI